MCDTCFKETRKSLSTENSPPGILVKQTVIPCKITRIQQSAIKCTYTQTDGQTDQKTNIMCLRARARVCMCVCIPYKMLGRGILVAVLQNADSAFLVLISLKH